MDLGDCGRGGDRRGRSFNHLFNEKVKKEEQQMSIGENIKEKRLNMNMTQTELSKRVGVSLPMICQIERGTKTLSLGLAKAIADELQCELKDLVE